MCRHRLRLLAGLGAAMLLAGVCASQSVAAGKAAPARHPSFAGTWLPDLADQRNQITGNPPPWTATIAPQVDKIARDQREGRPHLLFPGCLPHGMPALMLITHNALEILESPKRITILGEGEGDNLRRIYTDGRKHPDDPDESMFGHSIGHWEGDTLVVDTVAIEPHTVVAVSEGIGTPNNGGMHIVERLHLVGKTSLHDDLTVEAPKILTGLWKTTRIYNRTDFEIVEGGCPRGNFRPAKDALGNSILIPRPQNSDGTPGEAR